MPKLFRIFRRYLGTGVAVFLLLSALGLAVTMLIPAEYRSEATILVRDGGASLDGQADAELGYADRRIEVLSKQVLSRSNLTEIAITYDLAEADSYLPDGSLADLALEALRDDIKVSLDKVRAADPKFRFQVESAVAFNLSFAHADASVAQAVTKRLVQLFLEKNNEGMATSDGVTSTILEAEVADVEKRLKEAEDELKEFKQSNVFALPELKESNMRVLEKTEDEISETRADIQVVQEKRIYLESELVRLKPFAISYDTDGNRVLGPEDRLKTLNAELASKRAKYSSRHPDIVKLEREIASLESSVGGGSVDAELKARLREKQAEAAEYRQWYSEDHPSVVGVQREISSLSRELSLQSERSQPRVRNADNPAYITTAAELQSAQLQLQELRARLNKLESKRAEYEARVANSPLIEREFNVLDVNYQQLLDEYKVLREKSLSVRLASSLNEFNFEQGLSLLEPASFPEAPAKPNRPLLAILSFLIATWAVIGTVWLRHRMDDRIWSTSDVVDAIGGHRPLSVVPEH